jgi:hypothetical protein
MQVVIAGSLHRGFHVRRPLLRGDVDGPKGATTAEQFHDEWDDSGWWTLNLRCRVRLRSSRPCRGFHWSYQPWILTGPFCDMWAAANNIKSDRVIKLKSPIGEKK